MKDSERIAYLETRVAELEAENATLKAENAVLKERLSQIEEMLGLNSKNSSKPPSSDIKGKSKLGSLKARKRGGQKGHKGQGCLCLICVIKKLTHASVSLCSD